LDLPRSMLCGAARGKIRKKEGGFCPQVSMEV
jgi:hypothetical protein